MTSRDLSSGKVRATLTLDADLVAEVRLNAPNLSAGINTLVRESLDRRRRHRALEELVDEMDARWGEPDLATVERFGQHLR